jgi:LacI family transcriptional regulator
MPTRAVIGLIFDYSIGHCRSVLRGIKHFAESRPHWTMMPIISSPRSVKALAKLQPQGLISWVFQKSTLEALKGLGLPWVSVCAVAPDDGTPRVGPNDFLIGQLMANHLLDLGLKQFGFIGRLESAASVRREMGFRWALERAGHEVHSHSVHYSWQFEPGASRWVMGRGLQRWVESLPVPVGVAAYYDLGILELSEVCHRVGLRIPEDVAMVGVANDDLLCEMARPSLSSVALPSEQIGYEAAALLDRMIAGEPPPDRPILLPPLGVVARQSSDILAIRDPDVAAALRVIRHSGSSLISVEDVLREVAVSRRSLERRFRKVFARSILEEIQRVRVDRAAGLLAGSDVPIPVVAEQSGFSNARHLELVFRRNVGMTPSAYRRQFRVSEAKITRNSLIRQRSPRLAKQTSRA